MLMPASSSVDFINSAHDDSPPEVSMMTRCLPVPTMNVFVP